MIVLPMPPPGMPSFLQGPGRSTAVTGVAPVSVKGGAKTVSGRFGSTTRIAHS